MENQKELVIATVNWSGAEQMACETTSGCEPKNACASICTLSCSPAPRPPVPGGGGGFLFLCLPFQHPPGGLLAFSAFSQRAPPTGFLCW